MWDADCRMEYLRNPQDGVDLPTMWTEHLDKETLLGLFKELIRSRSGRI